MKTQERPKGPRHYKVAVRWFPHREVWGVDFRDPSGKRVRELVGTEDQAKAVAGQRAAALYEGRYFPNARASAPTFSELRALHIRYSAENASLANDLARWEHILDHFGGETRIDSVKPRDVLAFRDALKKATWTRPCRAKRPGARVRTDPRPFSPATINRIIALLRRAYRIAVEDELIAKSPVRGKKHIRKERNKRDRICTPGEFVRLRAAAFPALRLAIVLGYETGMRLGEIAGLWWPCAEAKRGRHHTINLEARLIHLIDTKDPTGEGEAQRDVPLSDVAIEELQRVKDSTLEVRLSSGAETNKDAPPRPTGQVFNQDSDTLSGRFADLVERLGLNKSKDGDLRFHDFRHTAATRMRQAGVDVVTLKRIFGWQNWSTLDRYQTVDKGDLHEAVARVARKSRPG